MDKFLGNLVRDKITGFKGIATGHAHYLYGCDQYVLVPRAKDGKIEEAHWFDEGRLEVLELTFTPEEVSGPVPGGPQPDAPSVY